ncbi:deoxyguanosinetriphosphate triphosphohydrolase [Candidatus Dependentiae bacterium]|nr:deoxyguanosinetriphosphate triphosphohydrolase [Candidatus Dependentiae bacterium]
MPELFDFKKEIIEREKKYLSDFAVKSYGSAGRKISEPNSEFRTGFQRDRDRILHSHYFRRLKSKTQVFVTPKKDVLRTRLTHTLEVSQIARTIARALKLNEDLVEAISLGHDLGHTPFGHAGEEALNKIFPQGFKHNIHSVRVVEHLAKDGKGLNLTKEVLEGIQFHSKGDGPIFSNAMNSITLEAQVVRISDRIAYINHDLDDALSEKIIDMSEIPEKIIKILGSHYAARLNNMIMAVIYESFNKPKIQIREDVLEAIETLKNFMFENVYTDSVVRESEEEPMRIITELYKFLCKYPDSIIEQNIVPLIGQTDEQLAVDFIATLGDFEILDYYKKFICESYEFDRYLQLKLF